MDSKQPQDPTPTEERYSGMIGGGQYCGIQCLFSALKSLGELRPDFASLLQPKYIGSRRGSSMRNLETAARDAGLYAVPLMHLSGRVIAEAGCPAILHVKSNIASQSYDHWVLFLGTNGGHARVIDPPHRLQNISFDELCARWDGAALLISREPIDVGRLYLSGALQIATLGALAVYAALLLGWIDSLGVARALRRLRLNRLVSRAAIQGAIVLVASCIFATAAHHACPARFLGDGSRIRAVQDANASTFLPRVAPRDVRSLLARNALFVDARFAHDFKHGHVDGAINIPPGTAPREISHRLVAAAAVQTESLDGQEIVVYCQSKLCPFAGQVASRLTHLGWRRVSILDGGWTELRAWEKQTNSSSD